MNELEVNDPAVIQAFGHLLQVDIGLSAQVRHASVTSLNRLLAHTLALRDLYKKAHWQTYGVTFYQLHLLFDKLADEQTALADELAERVQTLGGVALAPRPTWFKRPELHARHADARRCSGNSSAWLRHTASYCEKLVSLRIVRQRRGTTAPTI
jgi:hypothetical protein